MSPQRRPVQFNSSRRGMVYMSARQKPQTEKPATNTSISAVQVPDETPLSVLQSKSLPQPITGNNDAAPVTRVQPIKKQLPTAAELARLMQNKPINKVAVPVAARQQKQAITNEMLHSTTHSPKSTPIVLPRLEEAEKNENRVNSRQAPVVQQKAAPKPLFEALVNEQERKSKNHKSRRVQFAFIGAGITVFVIGIAVSIMGIQTNKKVESQVQGVSHTVQADSGSQAGNGDDPVPTESPLSRSSIAAYKVPAENPRKLIIPKIGVDTRITGLGLKASGELATPSNIFDVGWYNASAKPGQTGATLIDGHVHGPTKPGIFYNLKKLSKDDVIIVEKGDGKQLQYKVVDLKRYDATNTDMQAAMRPIDAGKSGLNLITCTGKIDKKTNTYTERLIVFATLVQ